MSLVDLLCDDEDKNNKVLTADYVIDDQIVIDNIESLPIEIRVSKDTLINI